MTDKIGLSLRPRTSARLRGRSHPKIYDSDHEEEEEGIEIIPPKRRATSQQRDKSKSVERQKRETRSERASSQGSSVVLLKEEEEDGNDNSRSTWNYIYEDSLPSTQNEQDDDPMLKIPSSLAALFAEAKELEEVQEKRKWLKLPPISQLPAKRTRRLTKTPLFDNAETERKVLQILGSVPSHHELQTNPHLQQLAPRKPYAKRSSPYAVYVSNNPSTSSSSSSAPIPYYKRKNPPYISIHSIDSKRQEDSERNSNPEHDSKAEKHFQTEHDSSPEKHFQTEHDSSPEKHFQTEQEFLSGLSSTGQKSGPEQESGHLEKQEKHRNPRICLLSEKRSGSKPHPEKSSTPDQGRMLPGPDPNDSRNFNVPDLFNNDSIFGSSFHPEPPSKDNNSTPLSSFLQQLNKEKSPITKEVDLAELAKRSPPKDLPQQKGIFLTSQPIDDAEGNHEKIEVNDEGNEKMEKVGWPKESNKIDPMVEFMCEKIHESKQQTRRAWQATRETLQKLREKEQAIRDLKQQLENLKNQSGLSETLTRSLRDARQLSSYATMPQAARRNAQFVFYMVLQQTFPNFSNQDLKLIFQDSISSTQNPITQFAVQKARFISEMSKEMEQREQQNDDDEILIEKEVNGKSSQLNKSGKHQQIKTMSPLAIIPRSSSTPRYSTNTTATPTLKTVIPQLLPNANNTNASKRVMLIAKKAAATKGVTKSGRELERQILKMYPALQYASPSEKAKYMSNKGGSNEGTGGDKDMTNVEKKTVEIVRQKAPPTLVRKFPAPTITRLSLPSSNNDQSNEATTQQRRRISTPMKRAIPLRLGGSLASSWHISGDGQRQLILSKKKTQTVQEMAEATERAQLENKRRLEALIPVKIEPEDPI